jgi:tRNA pseudouridine38-40 synthase
VRTVKLVIGFQGTRYEGWQSQKKGNTVQEIFEKFLKKILKEETDLISSSRTDSGVHALGLVAHFKTKSALPDQRIKEALNFYLPKDILVHSAKTMPADFHARYHAKSKLYRYDIWNRPTRPLFESPFVLWYPYPLDVKRMKEAAVHFKGKHDFSSLQDKGDEKKNFVRTIKRLSIRKEIGVIRIEVEADGYLRHMVRVLVGTLMEAGRKKISPKNISQILRSKDRSQAGPTAKPHGLMLVKVKY